MKKKYFFLLVILISSMFIFISCQTPDAVNAIKTDYNIDTNPDPKPTNPTTPTTPTNPTSPDSSNIIKSVDPADNADLAYDIIQITIFFNQPIDENTFNFSLKSDAAGDVIGSIAFYFNSTVAKFFPSRQNEYPTAPANYTAIVYEGLKTQTKLSTVKPYIWHFRGKVIPQGGR